MKRRRAGCWATLSLISLTLAGCAGPGLTTGRDAYMKSIKPYIAYWEKEGMTVEGRRRDSVECGASSAPAVADNVMFPPEVEKAERRGGDTNDMAAFWRLREKWNRCMEAKGYRYVKE